jgi:hypothetical protein
MIRSPEEIEAANRYHAYFQGWRDGATAAAKKYEGHRLADIYNRGYADGLTARGEAARRASAEFGYVPSVLR